MAPSSKENRGLAFPQLQTRPQGTREHVTVSSAVACLAAVPAAGARRLSAGPDQSQGLSCLKSPFRPCRFGLAPLGKGPGLGPPCASLQQLSWQHTRRQAAPGHGSREAASHPHPACGAPRWPVTGGSGSSPPAEWVTGNRRLREPWKSSW